MHPPEAFEHHAAVYDYAERNGLSYVWESMAAFEKRKRLLSPEQYQILAVHTRSGVTQVLLFSKDILRAELRADAPRGDALAPKRAQRWEERQARMKRAVEEHRSRGRRAWVPPAGRQQ